MDEQPEYMDGACCLLIKGVSPSYDADGKVLLYWEWSGEVAEPNPPACSESTP